MHVVADKCLTEKLNLGYLPELYIWILFIVH